MSWSNATAMLPLLESYYHLLMALYDNSTVEANEYNTDKREENDPDGASGGNTGSTRKTTE